MLGDSGRPSLHEGVHVDIWGSGAMHEVMLGVLHCCYFSQHIQ